MNELITILSAIGIGLIFTFINKKKKKKPSAPPSNLVAAEARDDIQEKFEEEIDRIESAVDGDTPADDLADLGNARRR